MEWHDWLTSIRFWTLAAGLALSLVIYLATTVGQPEGSLVTIRLTQYYGFASLIFLYLSLLASPLTQAVRSLPYRGEFIRSRRSLGLLAFYFGWLHILIAFFGQLQGFAGLGFLSRQYLVALALGLVAIVIMTAMAITANDAAVAKLGFGRWKNLHRLIYLGGWLILVHVLILGTHYANGFTSGTPLVTLAALIFLLGLEVIRINRFFSRRSDHYGQLGSLATFGGLLVMLGIGLYVGRSGGAGSGRLGIHAQHILLAQQAQQQSGALPSLTGDRNKRYTVSFDHSDAVPGQPITLDFTVYDASSGLPVAGFQKLFDKPSHLVIVDDQLAFYSHIHPDVAGAGFTATTSLPASGRYHLYFNYQPIGAIEQQVGFTLNLAPVQTAASSQPVDQQLTKTFGGYQVSLAANTYQASKLSVGQQNISISVKDANGRPVTTLKPYLAAFGHLVMINQKTYDYIHVHPSNVTPPASDASAGPSVDFLPLGLYGPIKPGIYRVFVQLNPDNNLITADFTVKVE